MFQTYHNLKGRILTYLNENAPQIQLIEFQESIFDENDFKSIKEHSGYFSEALAQFSSISSMQREKNIEDYLEIINNRDIQVQNNYEIKTQNELESEEIQLQNKKNQNLKDEIDYKEKQLGELVFKLNQSEEDMKKMHYIEEVEAKKDHFEDGVLICKERLQNLHSEQIKVKQELLEQSKFKEEKQVEFDEINKIVIRNSIQINQLNKEIELFLSKLTQKFEVSKGLAYLYSNKQPKLQRRQTEFISIQKEKATFQQNMQSLIHYQGINCDNQEIKILESELSELFAEFTNLEKQRQSYFNVVQKPLTYKQSKQPKVDKNLYKQRTSVVEQTTNSLESSQHRCTSFEEHESNKSERQQNQTLESDPRQTSRKNSARELFNNQIQKELQQFKQCLDQKDKFSRMQSTRYLQMNFQALFAEGNNAQRARRFSKPVLNLKALMQGQFEGENKIKRRMTMIDDKSGFDFIKQMVQQQQQQQTLKQKKISTFIRQDQNSSSNSSESNQDPATCTLKDELTQIKFSEDNFEMDEIRSQINEYAFYDEEEEDILQRLPQTARSTLERNFFLSERKEEEMYHEEIPNEFPNQQIMPRSQPKINVPKLKLNFLDRKQGERLKTIESSQFSEEDQNNKEEIPINQNFDLTPLQMIKPNKFRNK